MTDRDKAQGDFRPTMVLIVVGLVCAINAEDLLGYRLVPLLPDVTGGSVDGYLLLCVFQAIYATILILIADHITFLRKRKFLLIGSLIVGVLGSATSIFSETGSFPTEAYSVGFALVVLACFILKLGCIELLASLGSKNRKTIVFAAVLLRALCSPLVMLSDGAALLASLVMMIGGFTAITVASRLGLTDASLEKEGRYTAKPAGSLALFLGFGILLVCLAFLGPIGTYSSMSAGPLAQYTFFSYFLAAGLFALAVFSMNDAIFSFGFKIASTMCLLSFILLAVMGESETTRFICNATFSFFECLSLLIIADLASYLKTQPLKLFGIYYLLIRLFTAAGVGLSNLVHSPLTGTASSFVEVALFFSMAISAIWLITEHNLNNFFWGNTAEGFSDVPGMAAKDLHGFLESRIQEVASEHGLTTREVEVLRLMAVGRSATFIAEELYVTNNTARKHISHIYEKCHVHSKQELLTLIQSESQTRKSL